MKEEKEEERQNWGKQCKPLLMSCIILAAIQTLQQTVGNGSHSSLALLFGLFAYFIVRQKKTKRWLICACASLLAWCIVTIKCWNSKEEQNDKQTISRTHTVYYTRFGPGCCQSLPKMTFDHLGSYRTGTCRSILSLTDHIFNWDHLGLASSLENKFKIKRKSKFLPPNTIQIGQSATIDR